MRAKNIDCRVENKIKVLEKMRDKGIWLVDASLVSLNKLSRKEYKKVIEICWKEYHRSILEKLKPKFIIIIGKRVGDILKSICSFKFKEGKDYKVIPQPQARGNKCKQNDRYKKYQEICLKYC